MTLLQPSSHTYCTCHTIILLDGDVALLFFTFQEHLLVEDIIFSVINPLVCSIETKKRSNCTVGY